MKGCGESLLGLVVVAGLCFWGINSCVERGQEEARAEKERRDALTPQQRAEDDRRKSMTQEQRDEEDRRASLTPEQRQEEDKRKTEREAIEDKERKRRAEEEYESDGLVLLRKSLDGTIGGDITGAVVNRRGKMLGYVQINFGLYDKGGALVGNALANVNGLGAGEVWRFKASSLGVKFHTYRVTDLSGF